MLKRIRFQYFSDLHLERKVSVPAFQQVADYLILAGDIGHPRSEIYQEFMDKVSQKYRYVFVVDGNHEWGFPDFKPDKHPHRFYHKNIILLEQNTFQVEHVTLVGTTLWTPFVNFEQYTKSLAFIHQFQNRQSVFNPERKPWVCVTHHLPSYQMVVSKYQKHSKLNRYANHLDYLFHTQDAPNVWVCGHSHCVFQRKIAKTDCRINTFGPTVTTSFMI